MLRFATKMTQEEVDWMYERVEPAEVNIMQYSVGEVLRWLVDTQHLMDYAVKKFNDDAIKVVSFIKGTMNALEGMQKVLKKLEVPQDSDQKQASQGVDFPSFAEGVLLDCVEFYHLHSTEEAEKLPFSDWFMLNKKRMADAKFQHNYNIIIQKKFNTSNKAPKMANKSIKP